MRTILSTVCPWLVVAALSWASLPASSPPAPVVEAPERTPDQTYLTFPEWYLVFSPEEIATYMVDRPPSGFPYLGHVDQFWQGYGAVIDETAGRYPLNVGYHVMVLVIGVSTTVEYAIHAGYETLVGRVTEQLSHGTPGQHGFALSPEDAYAAKVARDYVDFIEVTPWYVFDFRSALRGLFTDVPLDGPGMVRKWERRYALTTEYLLKALYADLIGAAAGASYVPPVSLTRTRVDRLPAELAGLWPAAEGTTAREGVTVMLPRYQGFTDASLRLARAGVQFIEIAGNTDARGDAIVLSVLVADDHFVPPPASEVLFEQPLLTAPPKRRVVLRSAIGALGYVLRELDVSVERLEHVFYF
jgi:hypothetical protein